MKTLLALALMATCAIGAHAQGSPPWGFAPDPSVAYRLDGDTVAPGAMAQGYQFEMVYDSICHVNYLCTEFKRNSQLLRLDHWEDRRLVHAPAPYLTFNSRTATFPIVAGDTVSFYRELRWYNPLTKWQDTNSYYALDTLEFIVHLVRASDGAPIAMIDSTGIMARTTIGAPCIYGSRPIMAIARYITPSTMAADSAFIGVTVRPKGSGRYHFTRLDSYTFGISRRLIQARYINYLAYFSGLYGKRNAHDLEQQGDARFGLIVERTAARDIQISFSTPSAPGRITVAVYDMTGRLVYAPYNSAGESTGEARYQFAQAGIFFVALLHDDHIVRTQKITID